MDPWVEDKASEKRVPPVGVRVIRRLRGKDLNFKVYRASVLILTFLAYTCYHASRKPLSIVKSVLDPEESNITSVNRSLVSTYTWPVNDILSKKASIARRTSDLRYVAGASRSGGKVGSPISGVDLSKANDGWAPFNTPSGKGLLGDTDLAFLAAYALGMYYSGHLGDRVDLRLFLTVGMMGSGIFVCLFGMAYWWNIHSLSYFVIVSVFAGVLQSTGWPSVVSIMGKWFGKTQRGLIMGVWNAHTSVGNILGSLLAASALKFGWGWSFIVPGLLQTMGGVLMFLFLVVEPSDVGLSSPDSYQDNENVGATSSRQEEAPEKHDVEAGLPRLPHNGLEERRGLENLNVHGKTPGDLESASLLGRVGLTESVPVLIRQDEAIGFWEAWRVPGVVPFAFCLFFAKLVAYTFLNWLPFYIKQTRIAGQYLDDRSAGNLSTLFDVGGVVGGILAGHLSDKLNARAMTASGFMFLAIPALYAYRTYGGSSMRVNICLLMVAGIAVNGPYALITTAVSADLGTHSSLKGNARALATVTAIIDGTGSVGAAVGPLLTGYLSELGWDVVFLFLMLSALTAGLLLTRLVIAEVNDKVNNARSLLSKTNSGAEDLGGTLRHSLLAGKHSRF